MGYGLAFLLIPKWLFWSYDCKKAEQQSLSPVAPFEYDSIIEDVKCEDQLIWWFYLCTGTNYSPIPSETQRQQYHGLVDAGADIIIGHHPM